MDFVEVVVVVVVELVVAYINQLKLHKMTPGFALPFSVYSGNKSEYGPLCS